MPTEEEVWRQIDHRLVALKLTPVASKLHAESERQRKKIFWRNRTNTNAATIPAELFVLEIEQMQVWPEAAYPVYKEVCQKQGKDTTPEFIRAVFRKAIVPLIEGRRACSREFLTNHATRTGMSRSLLGPQLQELEREAARLIAEWRRRTEIEALELEYSEKNRLAKERKRQEGTPRTLDDKGGARFRDHLVAQRTVIIRNLKRSSVGAKGINVTRSIAERLTEMNITPPARWNVANFNAAYRDPQIRSRLFTLISKVKVD